jgi:hypothetical protein
MSGANNGEFGTGRYSELKVLFSRAYYLGTEVMMDDYPTPGTRETCYFKTESEAKAALENWKQGEYTGIR